MAQNGYDNTNRGALFPAREKRTPNSPDYTGEINIDGVEYFISGWGKTDRNNKKFVSMAATPKKPNNSMPANAPMDTSFRNEDFEGNGGNLF